MAKYTDSLRGYAFETMSRCDFKCCYCGLDGRESLENWLQLTEEHLLPTSNPQRSNRDFIVCACKFCNTADNRYFDNLAKRGITLDGKTPHELILQRLPFVLATRSAYEEFWLANVKP